MKCPSFGFCKGLNYPALYYTKHESGPRQLPFLKSLHHLISTGYLQEKALQESKIYPSIIEDLIM